MMLDEFLPDIRIDVSGCPEPTMRRVLLETIRLFCERTRLWQVVIDDFETDAGETEYALEAPVGSEIVGIEAVTWNGGVPFVGYAFSAGTLTLDETPDDSFPLRIAVWLRPAAGSTVVPDLLREHLPALACGARWRLMLQANRSWSNPTLGEYNRTLFESGITRAVIRNNKKGSTQGLRVAPRRF